MLGCAIDNSSALPLAAPTGRRHGARDNPKRSECAPCTPAAFLRLIRVLGALSKTCCSFGTHRLPSSLRLYRCNQRLSMQAAARQLQAAAALAQRSSLLPHAGLPALTFQVTSLTSLAGLTPRGPCSSSQQQGRHRWQPGGGGAVAAASGPAVEQLLLRPQLWLPPSAARHQQQRHLFNFPGLGGELSKSYQEKKLLGWTPRQVFDVVARVEDYHLFVPWCQKSTVLLRRPPGYLEAELEVGFQMFVERYISKVTLQPPAAVHSRVDDSTLFSHLTNKWEFRLGPTPHTTWLTFSVDFAFKSPLYRQVASIFFEEVVQRMMGAFEGRCAQLYGASSLRRRPGPVQPVAAGGR